MEVFLEIIAELVERAAISGAGFFSWGISYTPQIPDDLLE